MKNNINVITTKEIKKLSKGKISYRYYKIFLPLGFFFFFSFIVFIYLSFYPSFNYIYLIVSISSIILSIFFLVLALFKKTYSKKKVDDLNETLIKDSFKSLRYEDRSNLIRTNLLKELKIENLMIKKIKGAIFTEVLNHPSLLISISESEINVKKDLLEIIKDNEVRNKLEEVNKDTNNSTKINKELGNRNIRSLDFVPFKGVVILLDNFNFNLVNQVEVREIKDSISKSYFYSSDIYKINIKGLSNKFDIYSDNYNVTNTLLNTKVINFINNLAKTFNKGIAIIFKRNSLVIELYGINFDTSLISYTDLTPGKSYLKKNEEFKKVYEIIKEVSELFTS
ncbi:MAG: DUF3137 domain-containing protein [Firmicutes bacterium]|uniref:DUF3137 domain-containing protein n=1 Tax=Candidatus Onthovivens merdipullorum TaxID=2840889 RepID=A0A9D9GUM9_9BACL|nr:DUF3137 domain-containing protein [Candidatus Onthovivens merdipullorum]